ncbi:Chromate resistance protein ChrB [Actinomycetospora sp. CA-101289]|uniref:Chromate resistance protein ChrB n=1 Tax=Actinomycetospora sp. CA-101289 TaxID=3239893 RepID=UPI003D9870AF
MSPPDAPGAWVLLTHRLPREPSTARVALWRKLKRLGVAQLADGVVALPADARTREQLEWLAEEVIEGGGSAAVWDARPSSRDAERDLAAAMSAARAAEYRAVIDEARAARAGDGAGRAAVVRRLRGELRRIGRRDHFPPDERARARHAVDELAAADAPVAGEDEEVRP